MLEYLVSATVRRKLLESLWRDGARGTASSLARQTGTAFAACYSELKAMSRAAVASESLESGRLVYEANRQSPYASALKQLVARPPRKRANAATTKSEQRWDEVRSELATHGAPLWGQLPKGRAHTPLEELLAKACELAHRDPSVAKVLPYLFLRRKGDVSFNRFQQALTENREKHTAGFMLAVAVALSGDKTLRTWSEQLRDKRRTKPVDFFEGPTPSSKRLRELAERNTPELARAWNYRLNMTLDDFRSVVEKLPLDDHLPS